MAQCKVSVIGESLVQEKLVDEGSEMQNMVALREVREEDWTKRRIVWHQLFFLTFVYVHMVYSAFFLTSLKWQTIIWTVLWYEFAMIGETAGVHRLWTHRSYKAKLPLRIFLMLGFSSLVFFQLSMFMWIRDHKVHHKYTDTVLDPHNAKNGFLYSHVGWLVMERLPQSLQALRAADMKDVLDDPVIRFEKRLNIPLLILMCLLIPIAGPVWLWEESLWLAFQASMFRWGWLINCSSYTGSIAHLWGWKPFNKNILPSQNAFVSFFTCGEGWHNYHHMFPWDYKASDTGFLNTTMHFIKLCERLGLAYDLKTASPELVRNVVMKYGDGSHAASGEYIQEIPVEALNDPSFLASLPTPKFNKHQ